MINGAERAARRVAEMFLDPDTQQERIERSLPEAIAIIREETGTHGCPHCPCNCADCKSCAAPDEGGKR